MSPHEIIQLTRRDFLATAASGLGGLAFASLLKADGLLAADASPASVPSVAAKARHCIFIFMEGAPSQFDLFYPKPKLNELHGQPLPKSLLDKVRFAFIKKETAVMAGPPMTGYSPLVTPQADDVRGCRCLYGLPSGMQASYVCSLPAVVDFGSATIGMTSVPQNVTFTNSGNAPLSIQTAEVGDRTQFARVIGCGPGTVIAPGASCTVALNATPANIGTARSQLVMFTSEGYYELPLVTTGVTAGAALAGIPTVEVIEYYNATLDHYFITWTAAEIANLDAGLTSPRWTRTGKSFKAFAPAQNGTSQVCRFYIPPALGNSHFFGRGEAECNATRAAHPYFVLEEPNYAQLFVPSGGVCPAGSKPIYRLFNNQADTNHRYTIERAVRDEMVGKGWIPEGDGADMIAMCGP